MQQDKTEDVTTPVLAVVLILVIGALWALLVAKEGKLWQSDVRQPLPCYLENAQYSNGALTYMFGSDADKPQPTIWQCVQGEWKPYKNS